MFSLLDKSLSGGTETDAAAAFLGSPGRSIAGLNVPITDT